MSLSLRGNESYNCSSRDGTPLSMLLKYWSHSTPEALPWWTYFSVKQNSACWIKWRSTEKAIKHFPSELAGPAPLHLIYQTKNNEVILWRIPWMKWRWSYLQKKHVQLQTMECQKNEKKTNLNFCFMSWKNHFFNVGTFARCSFFLFHHYFSLSHNGQWYVFETSIPRLFPQSILEIHFNWLDSYFRDLD